MATIDSEVLDQVRSDLLLGRSSAKQTIFRVLEIMEAEKGDDYLTEDACEELAAIAEAALEVRRGLRALKSRRETAEVLDALT